MTTRERAHRLPDELPGSEFHDGRARRLGSRSAEDASVPDSEVVAVGAAGDELADGEPTAFRDEPRREPGIG